jgi:hypothetical protein
MSLIYLLQTLLKPVPSTRAVSHHNNLPRAEVSRYKLITAFAFTLPTFVPYESRNLFPRRVPHRVVLCQRSYVCCFIHFIQQ